MKKLIFILFLCAFLIEGLAQSSQPYWSINGNDTILSSHFIGTSKDYECDPLIFKTRNIQRMALSPRGSFLGIGTDPNTATLHLHYQIDSRYPCPGEIIIGPTDFQGGRKLLHLTTPETGYDISQGFYAAYVNQMKGGTDYALLQLNQKPPKNYNAFYNGWSNEKDDMTETGVSIHHPFFDIKKIAVWKKTSTLTYGWQVTYTQGGSQQGSSGSPLFNSSGYVVGQQVAGSTYNICGKKSKGQYGRFDKSWHKYELCYELNPTGVHSGHDQIWIVRMVGDETCKQHYIFNNCDDLHTSDNVHFLDDSKVGKRQYDGAYNAKDYISAESTTIQSGTKVVFEAGNQIVLKSGFHATAGSTFTAKIGDCELGCNNGKNIGGNSNERVIYNSNNNNILEKSMKIEKIEDEVNMQECVIYPNPNHGSFSIKLSDEKSELQKIIITDVRGVMVYNNSEKNIVIDNIQLENPVSGIYIISLYYKNKILTSKFAVL